MNASPSETSPSGDVPSMLDLVRLSRRSLFPPGGRELYHQVALLTDLGEGSEVLVAACGEGITLEYFVREFGVQGSGVDVNPELIQIAEERARDLGLQGRMQFQEGRMSDLPYRDGVFDVVVAELGLAARTDPEEAVKELVRVVRPGGRVVLVQLVWKAPVDPERADILARHLGAKPLMLVELKKILRGHGVRRLRTEAWSDRETAFRPTIAKPFPDFAELFSLPEKVGILRRAWSRWGWKGVRAALAREREVHRLLTRERILGLDMLIGTRMPDDDVPEASKVSGVTSEEVRGGRGTKTGEVAGPHPSPDSKAPDESGAPDAEAEESHSETRDLPLFTRGGGG